MLSLFQGISLQFQIFRPVGELPVIAAVVAGEQ
ncbi:hypothetical protein SDC9_179451 [bioreactor metagenome]|uniref:Uncharacterized protein n=1 Tax=bioreactor metagenome TaxID=1076179 RepID=A0A645H0I0_9ZZZZ